MNTLICDGCSLFARSWFAAQTISTDPRDAVRLALSTVLSLLDPASGRIGCRFDKSLFAWDTYQNEAKQRSAKPQAYHDAKEVLKEALRVMLGTVNVDHPDVEADDVVATAVHNSIKHSTVYVVSSDKDLLQLEGGNCKCYSLHEKAILSTAFITAKFNRVHHPSHIALVLAIVGDSVDKISGITGYGPAKCKKLFKAVTPEMSLVQAADAIVAQLNEVQTAEFYASLDRTLLRQDVSNVPDPAPIVLQDPDEAASQLSMPQLDKAYRQVYARYAA